MPKINHTLPDYDALKPRWDKIDDCVRGEAAIKAAEDDYLPRPDPTNKDQSNLDRYQIYLDKAHFFGATKRTLNGLLGQVFATNPAQDLPALLEPLVENVDGDGVSLLQQSQKALSYNLSKGRAGLWADYPVAETPATKKQLDEAEIRPIISLYTPQSIINWRTMQVGSLTKLSLVVLHENYIKEDDGFEAVFDNQWRVLVLDEVGYRVEVWILNDEKEFVLKDPIVRPLDHSGNYFKEIPFTFIGAENNNADVDEPPLEDLANLNIGHYRNSADYEESLHFTGQPTAWFSGLTEAWVNDVLKGTILMGARGGVLLPEGGSAGILQVNPNTMAKEGMDHKERLMVALGARLVEQTTVQRTAKEASMDNASETSILAMATNNVSDAYMTALKYALMFLGPEDEVLFELNTDFEVHSMDAQERAQLIAEWQSGVILDEEMRTQLEKAGIATVEFDEWRDQREVEDFDKPITTQLNEQDTGTIGQGNNAD